MSLSFDGKSYCFTGKLADLKRSAAERETRARGGLTTDVVNERLDYLVIGSIPSTGWKHGAYGTKIEKARNLARSGGRLELVPETQFLLALAEVPTSNPGTIDAKVVVCQYKFLVASPSAFDLKGVQNVLDQFAARPGCFVSARADSIRILRDLYGDIAAGAASSGWVVECRLAQQLPLSYPSEDFAEQVKRAFEPIDGVDGTLRWFERREGTAEYIRLLNEIPVSRRIEGL